MAQGRHSIFICQQCGYSSPKWLGKCPECGEWGSLIEEQSSPLLSRTKRVKDRKEFLVSSLSKIEAASDKRYSTGFTELDRCLGGGLVQESVVLIGGAPGVGKSTLLLQTLHYVSRELSPVLYVSGEESQAQIKLRAKRLGINNDSILVMSETSLENIESFLDKLRPKIVAIDSIQTILSGDLSSTPGSVSQVRESAHRLTEWAKSHMCSLFFIGHVTKEGAIAGPKVLEHIVDTVLYFDTESHYNFRIIRTSKNRFGPTGEIGIFEMGNLGLQDVLNPSEIFIAQRSVGIPGSVVVPIIEGSRPILVEVQALVSPSNLSMPRRMAVGMDHNRLALLIAVLEKKVGFSFSQYDIFVNIAGGVKVIEPAIDLGVAISLASSLIDKAIPEDLIAFGEVGLVGEVRTVNAFDLRLKEAIKLGFKRGLIPYVKDIRNNKFEAIFVKTLKDAIENLF